MMCRRWIVGMLLAAMGLDAQAREVDSDSGSTGFLHGVVFADADGDGRHDPGEAGVADVKLSNGRDLVATDAQGRYRLPLRAGDTVFLIKPPQAELPRGADGMPQFWKHHFPQGSPALRYGGIATTRVEHGDFALRLVAREAKQELDVLVFGDPQPKTARQVEYFERDIVEPIMQGRALDAADPAHGFPKFYFAGQAGDLGLSLGDIVNDDLSLLPGVKRATARLGVPWLHLAGNHDLDFDATRDEDSLLTYRAQFGPESYAWEEAQASFVLLDDVIYRPESSDYIGGLREDQFAFLEAYLATLPRERLLVLAAHIPFHDAAPGQETFRRVDRERLFALLQPFAKVLLLTSHAHAQRHYFHDADDGWHGAAPLHEYVAGAACGGFWSGTTDADGIPDARMEDGTPNGYARLAISGNEYRLRWYVARDSEDARMSLHAPRVLRQGAYPAFTVSANVFMGMPDTRVEYRIDDGEWKPMTRALRQDPTLLALNAADDMAEQLRSYDRVVEATPSTHLWRGALPTDLSLGEHRIEVRAFDRWDGELRAETSYRLESFPESP